MEFIVGDYKVATHEQGWVIYRKHIPKSGKNKGEVKWRYPKYYGRLKHVLPALLDRMLLEDGEAEYETIEPVIERINEAVAELSELGERLDQTISNLSGEIREHLPVLSELGSKLSEINDVKEKLSKL